MTFRTQKVAFKMFYGCFPLGGGGVAFDALSRREGLNYLKNGQHIDEVNKKH